MAADIQGTGDPGTEREGEPTYTGNFPGGLVALGGRTQNEGVLKGTRRQHPTMPRQETLPDGLYISDLASDKFAVVSLAVDQARAYQVLPAEQQRKTALIMCFTQAVVFGDESSISNFLGSTFTSTNIAPGCFVIPASSLTGSNFALKYTCKQGLYAACAVASATAQVQCLVERFSSGTPIR
jgi:hypothetical protein